MMRIDRRYVTEGGTMTPEGFAVFSAMERDIADMKARLDAAAAVADATGGATVDTQARAELVAIKGALA